MKTTTIIQFKLLSFIIIACMLIAMNINHVVAQSYQDLSGILENLPKDLTLVENGPQTYRITSDYFNGDMYGNFYNKTRVSGEYTRNLKNGTVSWSNARIANANTREAFFPEGVKQEYMEGFTYVPSDDMVQASVFKDFPPNSFQAKNLIWDMMAIEGFAWTYMDKLKLNEEYAATEINGVVDLAGDGTFENKDIRLTWLGISKMNNEICALIQYQTLDNKVIAKTEQLDMKGRSHYWGTIWVSLEDKQIEHALMYEDVVMDLKMPGQPGPQQFNTTRKIVFEKLTLEL